MVSNDSFDNQATTQAQSYLGLIKAPNCTLFIQAQYCLQICAAQTLCNPMQLLLFNDAGLGAVSHRPCA